jgi:hypothetical protein
MKWYAYIAVARLRCTRTALRGFQLPTSAGHVSPEFKHDFANIEPHAPRTMKRRQFRLPCREQVDTPCPMFVQYSRIHYATDCEYSPPDCLGNPRQRLRNTCAGRRACAVAAAGGRLLRWFAETRGNVSATRRQSGIEANLRNPSRSRSRSISDDMTAGSLLTCSLVVVSATPLP